MPKSFKKIRSVLKCPVCKFTKEEIIPPDSCLILYECEECNAQLKPKAGDCCVFCSYGSVQCSDSQKEKHGQKS
jgi:hypothetical protein